MSRHSTHPCKHFSKIERINFTIPVFARAQLHPLAIWTKTTPKPALLSRRGGKKAMRPRESGSPIPLARCQNTPKKKTTVVAPGDASARAGNNENKPHRTATGKKGVSVSVCERGGGAIINGLEWCSTRGWKGGGGRKNKGHSNTFWMRGDAVFEAAAVFGPRARALRPCAGRWRRLATQPPAH